MDHELFEAALDEAGTVSAVSLTDSDSKSLKTEADFFEIENIMEVVDNLLQVHGVVPGKKVDGVVRMIHKNLNGLNYYMSGSEELKRTKEIIDELEVYIIAYNEYKLNLKKRVNNNFLWCHYLSLGNPLLCVGRHTRQDPKVYR